MDIAIAGAGEVATHVAELLDDKHSVVVVVPPGLIPSRLELLDVAYIQGDATSQATLKKAGLKPGGIFVAATDVDEANLVACVIAKRLGASRVLCLLSRHGIASNTAEDRNLAEALGIDALIRPAEQLANEILRIAIVPGALDAQHLEQGRIRLLRHEVEAGAPITRGPLGKLPLPSKVMLVMAQRAEHRFIPQGDTVLRPGDKVTGMGTPRGVHELLFRFLRSTTHGYDGQEAVIVGGGHVGLAVAQALESSGWTIRVIEANKARCELIAPQLRGLVIHGDGTDVNLLELEHAGDASVLIAVTNKDEKNLLVSLIGRTLGIPRIITRAERLTNEKLFERVGIDVVRSARGAAIRRVVQEVVDPNSAIRAELEHGDVHIIDVCLPKNYPPTPLEERRSELFAIVGAVLRDGKVIIPHGKTELKGSDHLLVVTSLDDEDAARAFFQTLPPGAEALA